MPFIHTSTPVSDAGAQAGPGFFGGQTDVFADCLGFSHGYPIHMSYLIQRESENVMLHVKAFLFIEHFRRFIEISYAQTDIF